jgi:hypothetical protein
MEWMQDPLNWALAAFGISTASSCASAVLPSDNPLVKILDVLAVNVGKAKNDPAIQKKTQ